MNNTEPNPQEKACDGLSDGVDHGLRIVTVCPYVKPWLTKHPDYHQHVDKTEPRHLAAVGM